MTFQLAQAACDKGGWSIGRKPSAAQIKAAERRWINRSNETRPADDEDWAYQCGGCSFFAALGADFGICWNAASPLDGSISFEHGGCAEHSERLEALAEREVNPQTVPASQEEPGQPSVALSRGSSPAGGAASRSASARVAAEGVCQDSAPAEAVTSSVLPSRGAEPLEARVSGAEHWNPDDLRDPDASCEEADLPVEERRRVAVEDRAAEEKRLLEAAVEAARKSGCNARNTDLGRALVALDAARVAAEDRAAEVRLYGEEHVARLEAEANRDPQIERDRIAHRAWDDE